MDDFLQLNQDKNEILIIEAKAQKETQLKPLKLTNLNLLLNIKEKVKNLSVIIDSNLDLEHCITKCHITKI